MITFKEGNLRIPKWGRRVFMVAGGTGPNYLRVSNFADYYLGEDSVPAHRHLIRADNQCIGPGIGAGTRLGFGEAHDQRLGPFAVARRFIHLG